MGEEWEKKRISTNPFLYTDGSLVEDDVLQAQITDTDTGNSTATTSLNSRNGATHTGIVIPNENDCVMSTGDPDDTPQVEVPRQTWTHTRASSRIVSSIDVDDEKVQNSCTLCSRLDIIVPLFFFLHLFSLLVLLIHIFVSYIVAFFFLSIIYNIKKIRHNCSTLSRLIIVLLTTFFLFFLFSSFSCVCVPYCRFYM